MAKTFLVGLIALSLFAAVGLNLASAQTTTTTTTTTPMATTTGSTTIPNTGGGSPLIPYVLALVLASGAAILIARRFV